MGVHFAKLNYSKGSLQLLSENIKFARSKTKLEIGIRVSYFINKKNNIIIKKVYLVINIYIIL